MKEKKRYSDEELKEFKQLISDKIIKAKEDLTNLYESIKNITNGTEDTFHVFNIMDNSNEFQSQSELVNLAERQEKYISHLEQALIRIENKTYGICRKSGELISKERLRIVPHTTLSISAKKREF